MTKRQLEELLQHERFLQWLARRLLRDEARAQDVVQETWLAVLHSNKSPSEVHRGWLAGVLRNLARRKLREEGRRTRREQLVARPHAMPPQPSRLDAEELRVRLAKLVLGLPEHYREALLLRYYEGLEPVEIAARTGVSASTIRTRIQRGLDRVRGNLGSSTLSVAPLLHVIAAGGSSRGLRLVPMAAAAVVLVASLIALQGPEFVYRAPDQATRQAVRSEVLAPTALGLQPKHRVPANGDSTEVIRKHSRPTLTGHVQLPLGVADDLVQIELTAPGVAGAVRTDVRGKFAIDLAPLFESGVPKSLHLSATHPECDSITKALSSKTRVIHISLQRRPLFEPELLVPTLPEETDEPAPTEDASPEVRGVAVVQRLFLEATVHLPDHIAAEPIALVVCRDGRCLRFQVTSGRRARLEVGSLLAGEPGSRLIVRAASRHTRTVQRSIPVWSGPRLDPLTLRLESGRVVRGRIEWENGAPAAGATVALLPSPKMWETAVDFEQTTTPSAATTADATGRFEFVVGEGKAPTVLGVASGAVPSSAPASDDMRLVLRTGVSIAGLVPARLSGLPVYLATSEASLGAIRTRLGGISFGGNGPRWSALTTRVDAHGAFRFTGLEPGLYAIHCAGKEREVSAPGTVEFAPRQATLTVFVTGDGRPLADARVSLANKTAITPDHGRLTLDVLKGVDAVIRIEAAGYESVKRGTNGESEVLVDLERAKGRGRLEVQLDVQDVPLLTAAQVKLRLTNEDGARITRAVAIQGGVIRIDALLPGSYKVDVDPGGWHFPVSGDAAIVADEVTRLVLRPVAGGRIRADKTSLRIEPAPMYQAIAQRDSTQASKVSIPLGARAYVSDALLQPGRYVVWLMAQSPNAEPRRLLLEVSPGKRTVLMPDYN